MVANPGSLWKMAAIVTKNRFKKRKMNSLNIVKSQCCYQAIKERSFGQTVSEEKNLIFSVVFYFLLICFTNFQVWEAATAMFDGELYMHCSFIAW
jgi:hypothetical protein